MKMRWWIAAVCGVQAGRNEGSWKNRCSVFRIGGSTSNQSLSESTTPIKFTISSSIYTATCKNTACTPLNQILDRCASCICFLLFSNTAVLQNFGTQADKIEAQTNSLHH